MIRPTLEQARHLAEGNTMVPICMELFSDIRTPMEILKLLKAKGGNCCILESVENGESWGRYTFLGFNPSMKVVGNNGSVLLEYGEGKEEKAGDVHQILKELIGRYKSPRIPYMPPFTGGFVGYFSYEYIKYTEPAFQPTSNNSHGYNDFSLMLFENVIAFDQAKQKIFLITNIATDHLEENYIQGVTVLKDMEQLITSEYGEPIAPAKLLSDFIPQFTKEQFVGIVEKIKGHIHEGDIFQMVPSIRFCAAYEGDLLPAYRVLRTMNPSAYMFYMQFDDVQIAGASPETLVSLKNGRVSTYPLAGTCKRLEDEGETKALIHRLLQDEKELAEHDMLVDLSRNDLGKICKFGTVQLEEYRNIKICSHVCHIASKVVGEIKTEYDAFDAMAAVIPAGTLSGAPKTRAMQLIDEIEQEKRGVYGGAVGYLDFTGYMDLCIGIRMAVLKDGQVSVQAGAGIVADSIPENEYRECVNKATAMMEAVKGAAR